MARSADHAFETRRTTRVDRWFDVWNEVPLVAQTTGMSCWAAAAAMLVGWRERLAVDPDEVARGAGRWGEFKNGLHPDDVGTLAERWQLSSEDGDDIWQVDRFHQLLEQFGPLWVGEASPGLHAIVVTGIVGDGTPEGTRVRVNDPWPVGAGERYTLPFAQLRTNFDAASRLTGSRAHVLHSGGRERGLSGHWRTEQRFNTRFSRSESTGDVMTRYGRGAAIAVEAFDVRAADRYIDTTQGSSNPLSGHGGSGENLYLAWNAIPDSVTAVDVVIHLHGFSPLDPTRAMLERKVAASGLQPGGRVRPSLGILPRGRKITAAEFRAEKAAGGRPNASRYTFPALIAGKGAGLEQLIQYSLATLGRDLLGGRSITMARLIIAVHSGAGKALEDLLQHATVRAACNPHEVHIFDALYASSPNIAAWARRRVAADTALLSNANGEALIAADGGGCRVIFGAGTRANSLELAKVLPTSGALRAAYRAEATTVEHGDIPRVFGRALLTSVRADLVVVPAKAHALVRPLALDDTIALAIDDDARSWLTADESTRQALAAGVREWIRSTDRSAIELLADAARRRHFLVEVNWQHQDFPGRGSRSAEPEALFSALQKVVPERRVPMSIPYHNIDGLVVGVPGNGSVKLFPEAKDAFVTMRTAARKDGVVLTILSGWRSAATQERLKAQNSNPNAAQGTSAHTYGLAVDLALTVPELPAAEISTASMPGLVALYRSPVYKWMALNGRHFGWFPYRREPWHWEFNPEGFKARFESGSRIGGVQTYGAPRGLFDVYAPVESLDDRTTKKGHAITRAKVTDALGKKILDLLWEAIDEKDVPRMRDRLKRFDAEIDRLTDDGACKLLTRVSKKGDLQRDFDYRFSRATRQRIRRVLREHCQRLVPRPPEPPKRRSWSGPKVDVPPITFTPAPTPTPTKDPTRSYKLVGESTLRSKRDRRLKSFKYWGLFWRWEVDIEASVNATDKELATIKARWENGEYAPELSLEFDSLFVPDVKVEREGTKLVVQLHKSVSFGPIEADPEMHLSFWEPLHFNITLKDVLQIAPMIQGYAFRLKVEPKIVVIARIDWYRILMERISDTAEGFIRGLLGSLGSFFGGLFGSALELVAGVMIGAVLAKLLLDDDDSEPIEVLPEDVSGWESALAYANAGRSKPLATDRFLEAALDYRRTFAKGFGDTLAELTRSTWRARLDDLRNDRQVRAFVRLPAIAARDSEWIAWSTDAGKNGLESVNLFQDDFVKRFRIAEKAFLFAVAAHSRGAASQDALSNARQTAKQQATVAGMATAVQHVVRMLGLNSYEFVDEKGVVQRRDGQDAWKVVVALAAKSKLSQAVIQQRLGQLAVEHLPVLKVK